MTQNSPTPADAAVAAIEHQIHAAQADLAQAEAAIAAARTAYDASLDKGREAAVAARRICDDAELDRDVARRRVEKLEASLAEAREQAGVERIHLLTAKAKDAAKTFETAVRRELPKMTTAARTLMRLWAEAEIARQQVSRASGDDHAVPPVEGFRVIPGRPRKEFERKRVLRWIHPTTGAPMDDAAHAQVYQGSGYAVLPHPAGGQPWRLEQQVEVDRVVYMEAERPLKIASLVNALHVPGLTADDQAGWSDPGFLSPHSVLAHLDTLENAEPADRSDRRERKVMLCQIAPAEVSEAAE